uniref:Magnesium transporter n=1 Tax=uncultured organism TaxID=155900 RepID=M1Q0R8_9ZZZZ|nr:magnesium transporter [uncultured organism]
MAEKKLSELHPADGARLLESLDEGEAVKRIEAAEEEAAAKALEEMEPWESSRLLRNLSASKRADLIGLMGPDDAVDILQEFGEEVRGEILRLLEDRKRKTLSSLLEYPEDTAGGVMTPRAVALSPDMNIGEAIEELRRQREKLEDLNYAYIVDDEERLIGVLPLRNMAFREPGLTLGEIMDEDVKTVSSDLDQEELARLFEQYEFISLPVTDEDGKLLGVVTVDDVIDVLRREDTEDMFSMVGITEAREESINTPWQISLKHRLPWLFVNLGTAFLAALVVGLFQETIGQYAVLAVFMPVVAGQGGNSGSQTVAILIRALALGDLREKSNFSALLKESWLGLLHGLAIGLTVGLIVFLWKGELMMASIVTAAMICSMVAAGVAGVCIPLGLRNLGLDPALSATIWTTTVTDVFGFLFLLGLATWLLM